MQKLLILFGFASVFALSFPSAFEEYRRQLKAEQGAEELAPAPPVSQASLPPAAAGRSARLSASADGHYRTRASLNGRSVDVLVDTGATLVAIPEATARGLGLRLQPADFRYRTQTANGEALAARAKLDRVSIGRVELRDVEAVVIRGDGLGTTLLGMSFLGRLKRFSVENGALNLTQ